MANSGPAADGRDKGGDAVSRVLVLVAYALMVAAAIVAVVAS
jgi:hypothetical protein